MLRGQRDSSTLPYSRISRLPQETKTKRQCWTVGVQIPVAVYPVSKAPQPETEPSLQSSPEVLVSRYRGQLCLLSDLIILFNCTKAALILRCAWRPVFVRRISQWRMEWKVHCFIRAIRLEGWQEWDSGTLPLLPALVSFVWRTVFPLCRDPPPSCPRCATTWGSQFLKSCLCCQVLEALQYGDQNISAPQIVIIIIIIIIWVRSTVDGWGALLQGGRSRVRVPMPLNFFKFT
jgi:hypothetical protein